MNIGLFFNRYPKNGPTPESGYIYIVDQQFQEYPKQLLQEISRYADKAVLLCTEDTYVDNNTFSRYWVPDVNEPALFRPVEEPIRIDAILDKGYFRKKATFALVNVPDAARLGRNKIEQNKLFKPLQPATLIAKNSNEFTDALKAIPGEMVVVKPFNLNGGEGIEIQTKTALEHLKNQLEWPVLVQQFIDSSKGIGGLTSTVHDCRLYIIDGEPVLASVRTPKEGSLVANTHRGGTIAFFEIKDIPKEPIQIAAEVDKHMQQYGNRYYSVDFVNDGERWYVLEINDRPGIPAQFQSPSIKTFHQKLAACLFEAASNPINKGALHG